MPSKKPNKAAKRPGKATPKKATQGSRSQKGGAAACEGHAHPFYIEGTSETQQTSPQARDRKTGCDQTCAGESAAAPKPEPVAKVDEKIAPIKFDTRPLVMTRAAAKRGGRRR